MRGIVISRERASFIGSYGVRATEKSRLIGVRDASAISRERASSAAQCRIRAAEKSRPFGANHGSLLVLTR